MTNNEWCADFTDAPQDGTEIEIGYRTRDGKISSRFAVWSDYRVCHLGPRGDGWATPADGYPDSNLPLSEPDFWRPVAD